MDPYTNPYISAGIENTFDVWGAGFRVREFETMV